jgi:hypothetical protein
LSNPSKTGAVASPLLPTALFYFRLSAGYGHCQVVDVAI